MSHGIIQSLYFTEKLLTVMESRLGDEVMHISDQIVPKDTRMEWQNMDFSTAPQEALIQQYIRNMQFTVTVLEALKEKFGSIIEEIARLTVAETETARWTAVAQKETNHSLEQFTKCVWEPLPALGFEFTETSTTDSVQMRCTKCPIHDLSKMIGGAHWLSILECGKDLHSAKAFNPSIQFTRTKTLMKGDSHCNHTYQVEKAEAFA
ncbi:MAG: L-2-amino-thiazoline-4-carboxylic acid hydrolase [Gammaproteobacteria bacterium]|nr:L-2-amino-thiazoline-4-carboxylic acid hydrolase [Gammaproteobacteria bacterium]